MLSATSNFMIAFGSWGGAVMFNYRYARLYDDGKALAHDVRLLLDGADSHGWVGNDDALRLRMVTDDLSPYESVYTLPQLERYVRGKELIIHEGYIYLKQDSTRGSYNKIGNTELDFFRALLVKL